MILDLLATGATNLTNIRRLAGKLTPENHEAILARAVHKTREEIEILVRELDPLHHDRQRESAPECSTLTSRP